MAIDPLLAQVLDAMPFPKIGELGPESTRAVIKEGLAALPPPEPLPRVEDRTIPGADDGPDIPVRIYWPVENPEGLPIVVFYHGGGFVICDLDTHDRLARAIASQAGAVVVSVDYRLAPEHPFPAAVDDAFAALRWASKNAASLGADANRLAVAGDSAGGNLSAVVSLLARDAGGPPVKFQLLWYPVAMLDDSLPSMTENANAPVLTVADINAFFAHYTKGHDPSARPTTLAPGHAESLADLPPAYIATAEYDPLRDDGARYAELLRDAGVDVQLHNAQTLVHGYTLFAGTVPAATEATAAALAALKAAL